MTAKTKQATETEYLDPAIAQQIHRVNDHPELLRLAQLLKRTRSQKAELHRQMIDGSYDRGFGERQVKTDSEADAERLLSGEPLENLTSSQSENEYASRLRQLRACEKLIPRIEQQQQETYFRLCREELVRLRPVLSGLYDAVLAAFEALDNQLHRWREFHNELERHGVYHDCLGQWKVTDLESQLLNGGNRNMALELYVRTRREAVGLPTEGSE